MFRTPPSAPVRVTPREETAAREIAGCFNRLVIDSRDLQAEKVWAEGEAADARRRSALAAAKVTFDWTVGTIAFAAFGGLAAAAVFTLDVWMFMALGWPLPAATLFGTLVSSLYAGFGILAKSRWGIGTAVGRLQGIAALIVLAAVAAWLVPLLAAARAEELIGPKLDAARVEKTSAALYAKDEPAEAAQVKFKENEITSLEQERDVVTNVAAGALAGALLVEVAFAGYTAAVPLAWRVRTLETRARRFDADAADADNDAANAVTEAEAAINGIGTRLGLDVDTTTRIASEQWRAHHALVAVLTGSASGPSGSTSPEPAREHLRTGERSAVTRPTGDAPVQDEPADVDQPTAGSVPRSARQSVIVQDAWDGVWA